MKREIGDYIIWIEDLDTIDDLAKLRADRDE